MAVRLAEARVETERQKVLAELRVDCARDDEQRRVARERFEREKSEFAAMQERVRAACTHKAVSLKPTPGQQSVDVYSDGTLRVSEPRPLDLKLWVCPNGSPKELVEFALRKMGERTKSHEEEELDARERKCAGSSPAP